MITRSRVSRLAGSVVAAGLIAAAVHPTMSDTPDPCHEVESWVSAGPVALGDVHVHRGPLDFQAPRLAGCLRNDGDARIDQVMLEFSSISEGTASGGFSTNLRLEGLEGGESTPFFTDERGGDEERYERFQIVGYRFSGVNALIEGEDGRPEFEAEGQLELPRMLAERPEHELEPVCRETDPGDGEGDIWISQAKLQTVAMPGTYNVVGCITNRSDETVADGRRHDIATSYSGRVGDEPNRLSLIGGQARVYLPAPLEPGASSLFVSGFDFSGEIIEVEIHPSRYELTDAGYRDLVPAGPTVSLSR